MKLFKIIMNCVIAALLVVSITINILAFCGFKLVSKDTYTPDTEVSLNDDSGDPTIPYEEPEKDHNNYNNYKYDNDTSNINEAEEETEANLVYQDRNVTVTFCGVKKETDELTYLFEITNTLSKPVNITFENLYINGRRCYVSGLTCEKLQPGQTVVDDFVVSETEITNPGTRNEFVFTIKIMNAKSYLDIYETEQLTVLTY